MDLNKVYVADIETNGLLDEVTKMHILVVGYKNKEGVWDFKSTNKKEDVVKLFCNPNNYIVMHNGRRFDVPAIEKVFSIKVSATVIDSLALAWYLEPSRIKEGKKFGLESYGEDFGVPKPVVKDEEWKGISDEEENILISNPHHPLYNDIVIKKQDHYNLMVHRATEDVKINIVLWERLLTKLNAIYENDEPNKVRVIKLLNWIMDCSMMQEKQKIKVDVKKTLENLNYFEGLKNEKIEILKAAMPKIPVKTVKNFPKKGLYKADGSLSKAGESWLTLLKQCNLPLDYTGPIEVITKYDEPNPNSVAQKKEWLYSLGWKPTTFKHNRDKATGEVKVVEQIMTDDKMLCPSVLKLVAKEPAIDAFDGLTVLTHRIGILKSFLNNKDENDMVAQGLQSLAVTMRWMHSLIVNLPRYTGSGDIRDGKWIRECLIAGEGKKIVQSDLSGIESRTSDHYTFHINPERIKKTKMPYFDPHCEISVFANLMTPAEEVFFVFKAAVKDDPSLDVETFSELYKPNDEVRTMLALPEDEQKSIIKRLKIIRSKGKTCNYSSLYLVGAETLSRTLEISKKEAQELIDAYWKIHYAVKEFSSNQTIKKVGNEDWIWNPISNLWYFLRNVKDVFSVINQSSAVYCFNIWVYNCTKLGIWPVTQSHDDQLYVVDEQLADKTVDIIRKAMDMTNQQLKLNVLLDCETQIGNSVAETH
jgi:hypothetical protein